MRKLLYLFPVLLLQFSAIAQPNKKGADTLKPLVFDIKKPLPKYLKLVKAEPLNNTVVKVTPGLVKNVVKYTPSLFEQGMVQQRIIPLQEFKADMVALIIPVRDDLGYGEAPNRQEALIPVMAQGKEYVFSASAPFPLHEMPAATLKISWKLSAAGEDAFYLSETGRNDRLGISKAPGAAMKVTMLPAGDAYNTKFYLYQSDFCNGSPLWLYSPAFHAFIGRKVKQGVAELFAVPAKDVLAGNRPEGVSFRWDIKKATTYNQNATGNISYGQYRSLRITDIDGDGHGSISCGGDDCDDNDPNRFPGNQEVCDANQHDEDCNTATYGLVDFDNDGHYDNNCANCCDANGKPIAGDDCDDHNPAIIPGAVVFISPSRVSVCGSGVYDVEPDMIAIRQPNGTAIIVPKR